jgi:hypothetical protein
MSLCYAGHVTGWDESICHSEVAKQYFVAFYVQAGRIVARAAMLT